MSLWSSLDRVARAIDAISIASGKLVAWLIVPMVLSLVWEVFARYLFTAPTVWAYDVTYMLYGTFFMLGAAFTLQRKGHIRTDTFYGRWSPRRQAITDLVCYFVLFFPGLIALFWFSLEFFLKSFSQGERVVTSPWMPVVYPFKFVMPLASALLLLQGAAEVLRALRTALNGERA